MAGGTGGHVFPGLAVAHDMCKHGWNIEWIGTRDKMEAEIVPKHGFQIHFIDIGGLRGKSIARKLLTPFKLLSALFQSIKLLRRIKPNAVLGMGGYASGPGGIAAWLLKLPLVIHEQNAVFGMTNRYLAKVAERTLTGFDLGSPTNNRTNSKVTCDKTCYVGNPIREGFNEITVKSSQDPETPVNILIVGGSLGALALNKIVPKTLLMLAQEYKINVKHQSGKNKNEQVNIDYEGLSNVEVVEFIDDMEGAYTWSDIIICRSGALTVAEVAGSGRVALFVPLPIAVDDHQTANAKYLSDKDAAVLIPQPELGSTLQQHLRELCASPQLRHTMAAKAKALGHPQASTEVCKIIKEVSNYKPSKPQIVKEGQL